MLCVLKPLTAWLPSPEQVWEHCSPAL